MLASEFRHMINEAKDWLEGIRDTEKRKVAVLAAVTFTCRATESSESLTIYWLKKKKRIRMRMRERRHKT